MEVFRIPKNKSEKYYIYSYVYNAGPQAICSTNYVNNQRKSYWRYIYIYIYIYIYKLNLWHTAPNGATPVN